MPRAALALVVAGFRRQSTYRQATFAGMVTNIVFGFLRCYVMLAVADGAGGQLRGYSGPQLATYVWIGQGLLAVVNMWVMLDLAERVRTGDVVSDLLRPVNPLWTYMWTDLGRSLFSAATRFVAPMAAGVLFFELYFPRSAATYLLFPLSVAGAVLVGFAGRYLVGLAAFWLLDVRGVVVMWGAMSTMGSGLYFPLPILPEWLYHGLYYGTPFPAMIQIPVDVVVERAGAEVVLLQAAWAGALLALCALVQHRATRKLVVQGG